MATTIGLVLRRVGELPLGVSLPPSSPSGVVGLSPETGLSVVAGRRGLGKPALGGRTAGTVAAYDERAGVVVCALGGKDEGKVGVVDDGSGGAGGGAVRVVDCFVRPVIKVGGEETEVKKGGKKGTGKGGEMEESAKKGKKGKVRAAHDFVPVGIVGIAGVERADGEEEVEGKGGLVVVANKTGAVSLLRGKVRVEGEVGGGGTMEVFKDVAKLGFSEVIGIDVGIPGHVGFLGRIKGKMGIYVLKVRTGAEGEVEAELFSVWWCPPMPKIVKVVGFSVTEHGAWLLYETGALHYLTPASVEGAEGVERWRGNKKGIRRGSVTVRSPALNPCNLKFILNLLPRPGGLPNTVTTPKTAQKVGGVASMGGKFLLAGFGRVVSVWDCVYGTGHGFVETTEDIVGVGRGAADGEGVVLLSDGSVFSVTMGLDDIAESLTLGVAIQRQSVCKSVLKDMEWKECMNARLNSQPVAMSALHAAAEAGGESASQLLSQQIKQDEKEDFSRLKQARDSSSGASKLRGLMGLYVHGSERERKELEALSKTPKSGTKHGKHRAGLSRLPSERLSATVVARCLMEMNAGRSEFAIPLIDTLSTGVVGAEMVKAVMVGLTSSSDVPVTLSLTAGLFKTVETSYALEAVLMRVSDLPELDVVRAAQYAVRLREHAASESSRCLKIWKDVRALKRKLKSENRKSGASAEVEDSRGGENDAVGVDAMKKKGEADLLLARVDRVLARCINYAMDSEPFCIALRRIPPRDVLGLLAYCEKVLVDYRIALAATRVTTKAARKRVANKAPSGSAPTLSKPSAILKSSSVADNVDGGVDVDCGDDGKEVSKSSEKARAKVSNTGKGKIARLSLPDSAMYLGEEGWVNERLHARVPSMTEECGAFRFQAKVAEWVGRILECHMMTLVIDETGSEVVSKLLSTIRTQKAGAEAVSPLVGIVEHLQGQHPLPDGSDPLYDISTMKVPAFASL